MELVRDVLNKNVYGQPVYQPSATASRMGTNTKHWNKYWQSFDLCQVKGWCKAISYYSFNIDWNGRKSEVETTV